MTIWFWWTAARRVRRVGATEIPMEPPMLRMQVEEAAGVSDLLVAQGAVGGGGDGDEDEAEAESGDDDGAAGASWRDVEGDAGRRRRWSWPKRTKPKVSR